MTTKSKTFYVSEKAMEFLGMSFNRHFGAIQISSCKEDNYVREITVSWKEDRMAQVSESQVRDLLKNYDAIFRNEIIGAIFNNKE